ncbi:hypothetical protein [Streptomyces sp. NPDC051776]|uniref:hypothetical protein n=1 Tax=Streptomyces sp. NPDC051776 TaxID=3155414 RepID=UPI003437FFA7
MRNIIRLSAVGVGLFGALVLASPAMAEGPNGTMQMCSKQTNPGILGGLLPNAGNQAESCVTSSAVNPGS